MIIVKNLYLFLFFRIKNTSPAIYKKDDIFDC